MASKVAEAYVAIKAGTEALASGLGKAKALSVSGVRSIASGSAAVLKGGFNVAWSGVGTAAKAASAVATTAWSQAKNTLNQAKEAANQLAGAFKIVGVALVGIALTADTSGVRVNAMLRGSGQAAGFSREQLDAMAAEIGNASGASQRLVRDAQAIMLSFGAVRGDTFKQAMKSVPDLAAALGTDLPNAARTFGQALQTPAGGLELLRQLGVTITPVMEDVFRRAAEGSMQGWQRAQQYILDATKNATRGSAAELDGTLAGAVTRIKSGFIDMADSFAPVLVPAARALVGVMTQIKDAVAANRPAFEAFGKGLAVALNVVGKVVGFVIGAMSKIPPEVMAGIAAFAGIAAVAAAIIPVIVKIVVFIKPIIGLLFALLNPMNMIFAVVLALGAAVVYAFNTDRWGGRVRTALNGLIQTAQRLWEKVLTLGTVIWNRVKPAWDKFVERAVSIFETISAFITENQETWEEWLGLIGEIWGGVFSTIISVWDWFVSVVQAGLKWVGENSGITWTGIKDMVTGYLDFLSLVWSNFGLSIKIALTAISYAAVVAWDAIKQAFWVSVAAMVGAGYYIVEVFRGVWNNILASGERMVNRLRAMFTAIYEAAMAALSRRNPVTAYREALERETRRLDGNSRQFQDVGANAASAYRRGFSSVMDGRDPVSDTQRRLRQRLRDQVDELKAGRERQREEDRKAGKKDDKAGAARPERARMGDSPNPAGTPNMVKVEFKTVGLTDMWKQMQERISGGNMVALAAQQARATAEINRETKDQTKILTDIRDEVRNPNPAVVV